MHGLCEKCKIGNGFLIVLAGGVSAVLCPVCATEWHALTRDHNSARRMNWANAVMHSIIQEGGLLVADTDYGYMQAKLSHSEHSNILFDLAIEWLGRE